MATVTTTTNQRTPRSFGVRFARIAAKTILYIVLFILIILLFLQFPFVQNIIKKKVVAYLENKLDTRIEVGSLYVGWPQDVVLKDVYIEDKQKDTLLSGGSIEARLNLWDFAFKQEVNISRIKLNDITAKIKRQLPDTTFNFQFIVDAFAPTDTTSTPSDTSASAITLKSVELNNVRLVYQDIVSGTDMHGFVQYFDTKIDLFNPTQLQFDVPETTIKGLTASLYQVKPLARPTPAIVDSMEAQEPILMDLDFKNVNLENINVVYRNDVSATTGSFMIGELEVTPENIDLDNRIIQLNELKAKNTNSVIHIGNDPEGKVVVQKTEQEAEAQADAGWTINIASVDMQNNQLRFDNDNMPRKTAEMDYAHLKADSFSLQAKDIVLQTDSIGGTIESASFKEQSGFNLRQLQTTFLYSNKETYLRDLYLETPGTELKRNAAIRYASIEALANDIGNMEVELDLDKSHLLVRDLLLFVPQLRSQPAFADPSATWYLNSRIRGKVSDLQVDELYVRGLRDTRVDLNGRITGLPDMNKLSADISIRNTGSSKRDLDLFIPKGTLPSNITIPQRFLVNGELHTGSGNVKTKLGVNSDMGTVLVNGTFKNVTDINNAGYNANVELIRFDIGKLIQNNSIEGPVSLNTNINGTGYDPATANASFNGVLNAATLNSYTYRGLRFDGRIDDGKAVATTSIKDPNI
ncbi:MAG TPA: hypothetical protein VHM26_02030, partial [Chitinophagaceae bacterium]|nr:hypothetical protein [Chitinophagaceae bacterium]